MEIFLLTNHIEFSDKKIVSRKMQQEHMGGSFCH